jgi:hypothetical protein
LNYTLTTRKIFSLNSHSLVYQVDIKLGKNTQTWFTIWFTTPILGKKRTLTS